MSVYDVNVPIGTLKKQIEKLPPRQVQIPGPSAYEDALAEGFHGSRRDWLKSLRGADGKSAYEVAVDNGYEGTEEEWVNDIIESVGKSYNNTGEIFNDYANNKASGDYSHAEGVQTEANGAGSHAEGAIYEGTKTVAQADGSHAEGGGTVSKSDGSHSEGVKTTAGRVTQANAASKFMTDIYPAAYALELDVSTTAGQQMAILKLGGFGAHAEGMNTKALGTGAHSEGRATIAFANSTHAEGDTTHASGEASHAEGYNTVASGNQSHAEGMATDASGNSAHSEGRFTMARGRAAHAEGIETHAGADATIPTDNTNLDWSTGGVGAHAEGQGTAARGNSAHAEGWKTMASGQYSHSEGNNTAATGMYSHAGGLGTTASGEAQTVIGKYNTIKTNALFIVGNGTDNNDRSNAFEVYTTGGTSADGLKFMGSISLARNGWEEIMLDDVQYYRLPCIGLQYNLFKNAKIIKQYILSDYVYRDGVYEPAFCLIDETTDYISPMYNGSRMSLDDLGFAVAMTRATYEGYPDADDYYFCMTPTHYNDTVCPDYSMSTRYVFEFYK